MTYTVSGGALNSTPSIHWQTSLQFIQTSCVQLTVTKQQIWTTLSITN